MDIISLLLQREMKEERRTGPDLFLLKHMAGISGWGGGSRTAPRGALLPDLRHSFNRKADDWVDRELISCLFFFTPLLQRVYSDYGLREGAGARGGGGQ